MRLEVLPTWSRGATKQYVSERFQDSFTSSHINPSLNLKLVIHFLIHHMQKNLRKQQTFGLAKPCSICRTEWETEEDVSTDSVWINCSIECSWWVQARCVGIHYENTDKGKKEVEKWSQKH